MRIRNRSQPADHSGYQTRNIFVAGRPTSIRLEDAYWDALTEIIEREHINSHALVTRIHAARSASINLSGSVRVFVMSYFRALASQQTPALPPGFDWDPLVSDAS